MENISLILYTKGFFGSVLKSPTQMGSLSINNSVTNISRLGTFKTKKFCMVFYKSYPSTWYIGYLYVNPEVEPEKRLWGGGGVVIRESSRHNTISRIAEH